MDRDRKQLLSIRKNADFRTCKNRLKTILMILEDSETHEGKQELLETIDIFMATKDHGVNALYYVLCPKNDCSGSFGALEYALLQKEESPFFQKAIDVLKNAFAVINLDTFYFINHYLPRLMELYEFESDPSRANECKIIKSVIDALHEEARHDTPTHRA